MVERGLHTGVAHPGVGVGAALARAHIPHAALVPNIAHSVALALSGPLLKEWCVFVLLYMFILVAILKEEYRVI